MNKKTYSSPDVEIEKFTIHCDTFAPSNPNGGLEDNENWGTDNGDGGDDF